jgi:hypothetical protein
MSEFNSIDDVLNAEGSLVSNLYKAIFDGKSGSKLLVSESYLTCIHMGEQSNDDREYFDLLGDECKMYSTTYIHVNHIDKVGLLGQTFYLTCCAALMLMKDQTLADSYVVTPLSDSVSVPFSVMNWHENEVDHKEVSFVLNHFEYYPCSKALLYCDTIFDVTFKYDPTDGTFVFMVGMDDSNTVGEMRKDGSLV